MAEERENPALPPQQSNGRPVAAFVVSLIAGIWMLAMGGMMGWGYMGGWGNRGWGGHMWGGYGRDYDNGGGYDWMWQHHQMMHGYGGGIAWSWIAIAAGIVVLVGAVTLYSRPASARGWGIAIVVASVIDLFAGAGGFLAGILGLVGGILAIAWQPRTGPR